MKILAIDSSSRSIAFSIFDEEELCVVGKLEFHKRDDIRDIILKINAFIRFIFENFENISHMVIEQTIYIQNAQVSRKLSTIVGAIMSATANYIDHFIEVPIMSWKGAIGYKNVTRAEKKEWAKELSPTEVKKKAKFERKERVRKIVHENFPDTSFIDDDDICDAIGIGMWAIKNLEG